MDSPATLHAAPNGTGSAPVHVQLGDHPYPVYAQRIGYLENKLGRWLNRLMSSSLADDGAAVVDLLGDNVYTVLKVFYPQLMPEHEFRGYSSQDAYERKEYEPEADRSPSVPELEAAFVAAFKANRFDLGKHLGKLVDPELIRATINARVARTVTSGPSSLTDFSPTTGEPSDSMTSPTTPPMSTENTD